MNLSLTTKPSIRKKIDELTAEKFTGESVLRFYGKHINEFYILTKEIREDERPGQGVDMILNLLVLLQKAQTFGSVSMIWRDGLIRNYTVKLTFQGEDTSSQIKQIFKEHLC